VAGNPAEAGRRRSWEGLLRGIGDTPLVELDFLADVPAGTRIFAKLESANPGGSLKDRPVARMLSRAFEQGRFDGGRRLLDSSSGNAGIAYAMLGAALGVPVTLVVPENASRERLERIRAHGAELVLTDAIEGYDFALREAKRLANEHPELYWHADQYSNDENWRSHYLGTGVEILTQLSEQADATPDVFVAGVGTGGTITGVGRRLRETLPNSRIVAVIPELFPGIEGLKPLGHPGDIVPEILDEALIDDRVEVELEQAARVCHELAAGGLFVGPSSGANVHVARLEAQAKGPATIVTLLCDSGERYSSTDLWQSRRPA
jgi:cysteine synthase B